MNLMRSFQSQEEPQLKDKLLQELAKIEKQRLPKPESDSPPHSTTKEVQVNFYYSTINFSYPLLSSKHAASNLP